MGKMIEIFGPMIAIGVIVFGAYRGSYRVKMLGVFMLAGLVVLWAFSPKSGRRDDTVWCGAGPGRYEC